MDTGQPKKAGNHGYKKHHPQSFFSPLLYINKKRAATATSLHNLWKNHWQLLRVEPPAGPRLQHILLDALRKCRRGTAGKESHGL